MTTPARFCTTLFPEIIYGRDNAYGWRMEYQHIDNIKRDDLIAFYQRYFFPSNIVLAMQGDFSSAEIRAKLDKLFGSWNVKQAAVPPFPHRWQGKRAEREREEAGGAGRLTSVWQAKRIMRHASLFFFLVGRADSIRISGTPLIRLSAIISGRLFQNVRTKLGLVILGSGGR